MKIHWRSQSSLGRPLRMMIAVTYLGKNWPWDNYSQNSLSVAYKTIIISSPKIFAAHEFTLSPDICFTWVHFIARYSLHLSSPIQCERERMRLNDILTLSPTAVYSERQEEEHKQHGSSCCSFILCPICWQIYTNTSQKKQKTWMKSHWYASTSEHLFWVYIFWWQNEIRKSMKMKSFFFFFWSNCNNQATISWP